MASEVDMDTTKQQPNNPRQLTDLSKLKFPDPIQISIFEWDSGVSESVSSKNPYFSSFSKLNHQGIRRTVLSDGKPEKVPTLNKQKLIGNMANSVTTAIKGKTLADVDNQNSIEKNSNSDTKMECNSNFAEDSSSKKDSYLRSWKRILWNSNTQTSLENLSKLKPLEGQETATSRSKASENGKEKLVHTITTEAYRMLREKGETGLSVEHRRQSTPHSSKEPQRGKKKPLPEATLSRMAEKSSCAR
nr:hypothetical protein CFP56_38648 [Quercus suber]